MVQEVSKDHECQRPNSSLGTLLPRVQKDIQTAPTSIDTLTHSLNRYTIIIAVSLLQ